MSGMQNQIVPTPTQSNDHSKPRNRSWAQAYLAFLFSPRESLVLKVAPLALVLGAPEIIASNFLPVVGEVSDVTELVLWVIVILRTISAVNRYLRRD
jgi:hypothetical protein